MSKKNINSKNKVIPIRFAQEHADDPMMDEAIRESIKLDADLLEEELNKDPELVGVGASDDLFLSIVNKLKEQGIWEEDDEDMDDDDIDDDDMDDDDMDDDDMDDDDMDDDDMDDDDMDDDDMDDDDIDDDEEIEIEIELPEEFLEEFLDEFYEDDDENEFEEELSEEEIAFENFLEEKLQEYEKQQKAQRKLQAEGKVLSAKKKPEKEVQMAEELPGEEVQQEKKMKADAAPEDIYRMLPEEDLQALKLGREMTQKQEKKQMRKQKFRRNMRRIASVAAVFVILVSVGTRSDASRRLVLKAWDAVMTMAGVKMETDYVGESEGIRSVDSEESKAWEDAVEKLGISVLRFSYMPENMEFDRFEVNEEMELATFMYSYENQILDVKLMKNIDKSSVYYVVDEEAVLIDSIIIDKNVNANLWKTNLKVNQERYLVEFEYNDCRYAISGMISQEELKKIVKNLIFL